MSTSDAVAMPRRSISGNERRARGRHQPQRSAALARSADELRLEPHRRAAEARRRRTPRGGRSPDVTDRVAGSSERLDDPVASIARTAATSGNDRTPPQSGSWNTMTPPGRGAPRAARSIAAGSAGRGGRTGRSTASNGRSNVIVRGIAFAEDDVAEAPLGRRALPPSRARRRTDRRRRPRPRLRRAPPRGTRRRRRRCRRRARAFPGSRPAALEEPPRDRIDQAGPVCGDARAPSRNVREGTGRGRRVEIRLGPATANDATTTDVSRRLATDEWAASGNARSFRTRRSCRAPSGCGTPAAG